MIGRPEGPTSEGSVSEDETGQDSLTHLREITRLAYSLVDATVRRRG